MKDEIKEINLSEMLFNRDERLLDYITNLQEEKSHLEGMIRLDNILLDIYKEENERLNNIINKAMDKLYCYGEVFDIEILKKFQKEMLDILLGSDNND